MSAIGKANSWYTKFFTWVGLPVIAAIGLMLGVTDVVPVWQAKSGNGTVGTFTATREDCSRRSCTLYGDWTAADGSSTRTDVILYDDPDSLRIGGTTEALDSGARNGVFATAGGNTYLLVTGLVLAGVIAGIVWIVLLVRAIAGRRASSSQAAAR